MSDFDSPEAMQRRLAYYERMCLCGHHFGNHSMFSGCLLCPCGCPQDTVRTVEYTRLTDSARENT